MSFGVPARNGLPLGLGTVASLASRATAAVVSVTDAFFRYVSLLLNTSATNGAQNNTFLDSSTNNFSITRNGNTTQGTFSPFSQTGWSNFFDGTGDFVTVPLNTALDPGTGAFTFETWFYATAAVGNSSIFEGTNNGLSVTFNSGKVAVAQSNVAYLITDPSNFPLNQWVHVAASRSGTILSLFVNGTRVGTATNSTNFVSSTENRIGRDATTNYITGYLSNLRLVKGTAVYDPTLTTLTVPTSPLTAITNTSLLTCQSNRFIDNSSNAFAITRNGDVSVQAFSPFAPTAAWSASTNGGSGYFDGTGDYLTAPDNAAFDFGTGDFTIEFWANWQNISALPMLFSRVNTAGTAGWFFQTNATTAYFGSLTSNRYTTWTVSLSNNVWTHIALTRTGSTLEIFVNGVSQTAKTVTGADLASDAAESVWIGDWAATSPAPKYPVQGYLSNYRIVKGSRVYTSNFTPPTSPLTAITNTSLLLNFTNAGIFDSASGNDLETVGSAQVSTAQAKWGTSSIGIFGTGNVLTVPDRPTLRFGTAPFTIEAWVYSAFSSNQVLASKGALNTGWQINLAITTGIVSFAFDASTLTSSSGISANTWAHIAIVREGTGTNQTKIYINGVNVATGTVATDFNQLNNLIIGKDRLGSGQYNDYIDDLRITNGYARYTSNFTAPTAAFPLQ